MENKLRTKASDLATQGGKIAAGVAANPTIPMGDNTSANIGAAVEGLMDATNGVGAAKTELSKRMAAVRQAKENGGIFLTSARHSFQPILGYRHNLQWNETGLVNSLEIPKSELAVLSLLNSFKLFLVAHPALENADEEITAARADLLFNALDTAGVAVNAQRTVAQQATVNRNTKAKQLRVRLRGTINTLMQALGPIDPRWASFGLNQPGIKAKPEVPGKITASVAGGGSVSLKWSKAARAEYYRVWKKVVGIDTEYIPVGSPADPDFTLENLPVGATIEIAVSAVNNGGESALSQRLVVQMV